MSMDLSLLQRAERTRALAAHLTDERDRLTALRYASDLERDAMRAAQRRMFSRQKA